jgi:hypothetical protein
MTFGMLQSNTNYLRDSFEGMGGPGLVFLGAGLVGLLARKRLHAKSNQVPEAVWEALA